MNLSMSNMIMLALETATNACSVALGIRQNDSTQFFEREEVGSNIHSQKLLSMVQAVLTEAELGLDSLGAVAVGQGPGSFTGLRIGVGVAQGIAYGCGCPMVGVSSLHALADSCVEDGTIVAGIDARMGEIYWCEYQRREGPIEVLGSPRVGDPSKISSSADTVVLVGNAWQEHSESLSPSFREKTKELEGSLYPHARHILNLAFHKYGRGESVDAVDFTPHYVRNDVAKKSTKRPY
jgi:tRNA threonylcarbamoyladenosine biosynthesis protein TsaB